METVILNTVWVGTIHYTSGIIKSKVENLYNIFCNNETRSHYPLWVNGSSLNSISSFLFEEEYGECKFMKESVLRALKKDGRSYFKGSH